jgi:hypothetical protein
MPAVSVVMQASEREGALEPLLRPILADPETLEVLLLGNESEQALRRLEDPRMRPLLAAPESRAAGVAAARGDILLFVDVDVLATSSLVSAHAHYHAPTQSRLVLGYTPVRILHERAPGDFAVRLCANQYEARCKLYERDSRRILTDLWGGSFSLRRADCIAIGMADQPPTHPRLADREVGTRSLAAGFEGIFDRSLRALRLYDPKISAFVREARVDGAGRAIAQHPANELEADVSGSLAALVDAVAGNRHLHGMASFALQALTLVAGSAHIWRVQDLAARALWLFERERGALDAAGLPIRQ